MNSQDDTYPYRSSSDPLLLPKEFAWLRANDPVCRVTVASGDEVWLVTRYDDVRAVLANQRFARNIARQDAARLISGVRMPSSPLADPPAHTRWRRLVSKAFTARQVSRLQPDVQRIADELLDRIEASTPPVDLMERYAFPLPIAVVCELLGLDVARHARFRGLASAALATGGSTPEEKATAFVALGDYTREIIAGRRGQSGDDLLSRLISVRDDDDARLSEDELVATVMTLLIGGYENPAHQMGKALYTLFRHPEQLAAVRADPTLIGQVVEETLRYTGALDSGYGSPRFATADIEVGGVVIPKGATVLVIRQSANRDEDRFDDPDRFDIHREPTQHVVFGHGPHHCLGASLARMEQEIGYGTLLRRFPELRLAVPAEEIRWVYRVTASGPAALPVTW